MKTTENQMKLLKAFGREDLAESCHTFQTACEILIFYVFFHNPNGPHVDALRRYYGMWLGDLKRELTEKDYDEALKF